LSSPSSVSHPRLRPPCLPLFPYTTLFRSPGPLSQPPLASRARSVASVGKARGGGSDGSNQPTATASSPATGVACGSTSKPHRLPDRKSTRLNSSHEWISYAVFCLKKKTTT